MVAPPSLRYVRFDARNHDCQCCGRIIKKGTLELSDGRRYGPQCAARAMGRPRPTTADKREEERLYVAAMADEYRAMLAQVPGWTWVAKGYGGNCGFGTTDAYLTPSGPVLHIQDATTAYLFRERMPEAVAAFRSYGAFVRLTPEQVTASPLAGGVQWTTKRWAEWQFGKGWDS